MLVTTDALFQLVDEKYAIGAYNINNMEHPQVSDFTKPGNILVEEYAHFIAHKSQ